MLQAAARTFASRGTYVAMMGTGAAIGLLRGFVVAALLPAASFGAYSVVIALGLFSGPLLGMGKIEETRKRYPRLWVEGRFSEIEPITHNLMTMLARNAVLAALACLLVAFLVGRWDWALAVLAGSFIAFNQGSNGVLASALRAGTDLRRLAVVALIRAVFALALASLGAWTFGLEGTLVGEALGGLLGVFVARDMLHRMARERSDDEPAPGVSASTVAPLRESAVSADGLRVFLGTLAAAVPVYLSRPAVGLIYSPQELGTFAFLLLFAQGVLTGYGITDQMIGPSLVRMEHEKRPLAAQRRYLAAVLGGLSLLVLAGLAGAFALLAQPLLAHYAEKYPITANLALPLSIFATIQFTSSLDWMLQAHDRERWVLRAAFCYLALFALGTAVIAVAGLPLVWYLWVMAGAKAVQLAIQTFQVLTLTSRPSAAS